MYKVGGLFTIKQNEIRLIGEIKDLINDSKYVINKSINSVMVNTYYEIGRRIVEYEQHGKSRSEYGKKLIERLSIELTKEFGKGYSVENITLFRKFYLVYSDSKNLIELDKVFTKSNIVDTNIHGNNHKMVKNVKENFATQNVFTKSYFHDRFVLPWSLYLQLMRIKDKSERNFYEIEAFKNRWSFRELARQINSCLYERLVLSRDKEKVLELSTKGQIIEKPSDAIKDPLVLEFLDLKEDISYTEKDLEKRIIDKLQYFLLELGKGFTFVQRQKRLTFEEEHYYADLVLYNRILKCFVVIDLKIGKLKHQDIGQMQMYVNYFDRYEKLEDENKTIGILLCKEKNEAIVELTLPENNDQIFASKYETILPSKEDLKRLIDEK